MGCLVPQKSYVRGGGFIVAKGYMNVFSCIISSLLVLACFKITGFSQSSIITTYAGHGRILPVSGAQAVTQALDGPVSVVPDAAGGFYIASSQHHRVYRV